MSLPNTGMSGMTEAAVIDCSPSTALTAAQATPRSPAEARLAVLRQRGSSLTAVARELGKNLSVVSRVNRGERRSRVIESAIAERLGLSMADAFPERHG